MKSELEKLLKHPQIWRAGFHPAEHEGSALSSGFMALDFHLPQGGWPMGALTEVMSDALGIGELSVLMPALSTLTKEGRWVVWIAPPYVPYAPALTQHGIDLSHVMILQAKTETEQLWAAEQMLRDELCGAVLLWAYPKDGRKLRRLQLAAERGGSWGILLAGSTDLGRSSPVALRFKVTSTAQGLQVEILKCRGARPKNRIVLAIDHPP